MDPSHITEFASPRYFEKLNSLHDAVENANNPQAADGAAGTSQNSPFSLPIRNPRPPGARRRRSGDTDRSGDGKRRLLVPEIIPKAPRKPSFTSSITNFRFKVSHKGASHQVGHEFIFEEGPVKQHLTLADRFLGLPNELQLQITNSLPMPTILNLRLVSRSFNSFVSMNESPISRHHLTHSVPHYALRLYPVPDSKLFTLHYLCGLWHRLHVASKLADLIAEHTTQEIFLRDTEAKRREFEPQHKRMRLRLMPLLFTMFHFFEKYRELHLQHLQSNGIPLRQQPFTLNPIERQVMNMYDDQTLLQLHQVFPLVLSSFSRRLRPPSYAGRLERSIKGYLKDKPADEIYATIILIGGLRQAERFWEMKGYNSRRAAVDSWYSSVTREPMEAPHKSRLAILGLGRKKSVTSPDVTAMESLSIHDAGSCNEWDCVQPACTDARAHRTPSHTLFHTGLTAGPPMSPLSREELRPLLIDQQPLTSIWLNTAEALILERGIVECSLKIKRNTQVLLELIKEDGGMDEEWAPGLSQASRHALHHPVGAGGAYFAAHEM
ncbi:hypothetical protein VE03_08295 [Pseudogymnoascus sp. 23342-1-I1]|nr:hypothetical protein VE03_08295 [Pseudogymnoascus sp. 23342-1-I1]